MISARLAPDGGPVVPAAPAHFAQRVAERIGPVDAGALFRDLRLALADPHRWSDYVERVMPLPRHGTAWRFRVGQGFFYAVVVQGVPITVLTQAQMREYKATRRRRKEHK